MRRILLIAALAPLPLAAQTAGDDGEGFLTELIEEQLSDSSRTVDIQGFEGALSSRATIRRLTIADSEGIWLIAEGLALDWDRAALLSGQLEVAELSAERIEVPRAPVPQPGLDLPSPEATPFALPELPVSIDIGRLSAAEIKIGAALLGEDLVARLEARGELASGAGSASLLLERTDATAGRFDISVSYTNTSRSLDMTTVLEESAGGLVSRSLGLPGTPSVALEIAGSGPLDAFDGTLRLATDGTPRITGTFGTDQSDGDTRYALDLSGDVTPLFAPDFRDFFGPDLRLSALARQDETGAVTLDALTLDARQVDLTGTAAFGPDGWPARLDIEGSIGSDTGPVLLPLAGDLTTVDSVTLAVSFDADKGDDWDGAFLINGLRQPDMTLDRASLTGGGTVRQGDGAPLGRLTADLLYQAQGLRLTDPKLDAALPGTIAGEVQIVREEDAGLMLPRLTLFGEDLSLMGRAQLDQGQIDTELTAAAENFARFALLSGLELGGSGAITVAGSVTPLDGAFDLTLSSQTSDLKIGETRVDPLLAGPGAVNARLRRDTSGLTIDSLAVTTQMLSVTGNAMIGTEAATADLRGTLSDISTLVPGLSGGAAIDVSARRAPGTGQTASARLILPTGRADLSVAEDPEGLWTGQIDAALGQLDAYAALFGQPIAGAAEITARGTYRPLTQSGSLDLTARTKNISLGRPEFDPLLRGDGAITLSGAARIDDTPGAEDIETARITVDLPAVRASADLGREDLSLAGTISAQVPDLAVLRQVTGQSLSGSADLSATGRFVPETGAFDLDLNGGTAALGIGQPFADRLLTGTGRVLGRVSSDGAGGFSAQGLRIDFPNLSASADGSPEALTYTARLRDVGLFTDALSGPLTATGSGAQRGADWRIDTVVAGPGGANATLNGTVGAEFALGVTGQLPLALLNTVLAPRRLSGTLGLDLRVDGPPGLNALTGSARIDNGRLAAPRLAQAIENLAGVVTFGVGRARLDLTGALASGGGLALSGPVTLSGAFPADLALSLDALALRDPQLYQTTISGRLGIAGPLAGGATIAGALALGPTEIRVPSGGLGTNGALTDITHVDPASGVRRTLDRAGLTASGSDGSSSSTTPRPYPLDITVSAPSRVFVRGRGLDAELGGSLRLSGTSAQVVPSGQFDLVRGRLDILQQRFDLTEGSARLQGGFLPILRLVARTETEDATTIDIIVEGPADAPEVNFVSSPELPQDEVLARLLFGRSLTEISPLQAVQLAGAVRTLAGRGGPGLADRFRRGLDLDDLDITTDESGNAAVRAGKYISENVYSEVTVDSEGETTIDLNIDLTDSLTARGSVGEDGETSVGIFFERDY